MSRYLGNTGSNIDWDNVIKLCQQQKDKADKNTVNSVVDRSEAEAADDNKLLGYYRNVIGTWEKAGYNLAEIEWFDYYPGVHFPLEVQTIFGEIVGAKPLRVFVSEVWPGRTVPYHWDVEDKEDEWLEQYGKLHRYLCCIDRPRLGSFLVFDKECFYHNTQGDIYEWNDYRDFHGTSNAGEYPSYYFHFLGYKE